MVCYFEHWRLIASTIFQGIAGYSGFFYVTLLSPIETRVKDLANHSIIAHYGIEQSEQELEWVWAGTSASLMIGMMIGCATIKYPAEKFGRRNTVMILKNMVLLSSSVLQFLSRPINSIELLVFGRTLAGISLAHTILIAVFLAESSPTKFRGIVSSSPILGGRLWAFLGALVPLVELFNSKTSWNYLFLCPILPALIHLLATPFIPKSIKHLYISNNNRKSSETAIEFYHGRQVNKCMLNQDMDKEANISPTMKIVDLKTLLVAKQFRQPLILCVVAVMMWPIGGDFIVNQYSTGVLISFGIPSSQAGLYSALVVQLPLFLVATLGALSLERLGRRPLFLAGVALTSLGTSILSLATPCENISSSLPPIVSTVGLFFTVIGLTGGVILVGLILPGELAPQASRSLTFAVARLTGTFVLVLFSLIFPPLNRSIGSYCIVPLPVFGVIGFVFLYKFLPETKGKTVYQIVQPWMSKRKHGTSVKSPHSTEFGMPMVTLTGVTTNVGRRTDGSEENDPQDEIVSELDDGTKKD